MDNFKPCPFCGGQVKMIMAVNLETATICCSKCRAYIQFKGIEAVQRHEVFGRYMRELCDSWNKRYNED